MKRINLGTTSPLICLPGPGDRCPAGYLCQYSYSKRQHQCCSASASVSVPETPFGTSAAYFPMPTSPAYPTYPGVYPTYPTFPGGSFKNESFRGGFNGEEYGWSAAVFNTYWANKNNSATMATTIDCPPDATNRKCESDEADVGGCCLPSKH